MNIVDKRLKEQRKAKGYTQKQVADEIGVSCTTISQYENGICTPSIKIFKKLCVFYDVSADYLLGRTDEY